MPSTRSDRSSSVGTYATEEEYYDDDASSTASSDDEEEDSPPASPPAPAPAPCPPLSETRVKNLCHLCGDHGSRKLDSDGACEVWVCRNCDVAPHESCEHCEQAKQFGKAPVCPCERGQPSKKMIRYSPPETPPVDMDESW